MRKGRSGQATENPYRIIEEEDGWSVVHTGTGDYVIIAAQLQKGLTEVSATATCNALNNFAAAGRPPEREADALMRDRPRPSFHVTPEPDST